MKNWKAIAVLLVAALLVLYSVTLASRLHREVQGDHHYFLSFLC